ncbi:MAG: hypothetical protein KF716_23660 [Anaerolineae bacterium]|nr:hypothetical protein [Anaerolineae bacterium]
MDELIKTVVSKTNLSEESVKKVIDEVVAFLKEKLPPPLAGQVDNMFKMIDQNNDGNIVDDLKKGLGSLFGGN